MITLRTMYTQRWRPCDVHTHCTIITCTEDQTERQVWESHADASTHPECRANPDHRLLGPNGITLDASRTPCARCRAHFTG